MPNDPKIAPRARKTGLMLSVALAASAFVSFSNTDALVERGFAVALEQGQAPSDARTVSGSPVAGSEDFWLRQASHDLGATQPVSLVSGAAPVTLGETVKIVTGGRERAFEVVEIVALPAGVTRIENATGKRFVIVTCRDKANLEAAPLRLIAEVPADQIPAAMAQDQRAL